MNEKHALSNLRLQRTAAAGKTDRRKSNRAINCATAAEPPGRWTAREEFVRRSVVATPMTVMVVLFAASCAKDLGSTSSESNTVAAAAQGKTITMDVIHSKDGTLISYLRKGHGRPLVLVHGTTSDHTRFAPVLDALSTRFTVFAMDRRGRGGSQDSADYAPEREYEDIAAVVAAAGAPVFLLGHSFGGICALEAALRFDGVRKLILYEPPVAAPRAGQAPVYEAMLAAGQDEAMLERFLRENARLPEVELNLLRSLPTWPARVAAAHTIPREMRVVEGYRIEAERLASLRVPTLLLLGGDSPQFQHEGTNALHRAIPGSRIVVMPGQQHSAMMTAPDIFVREVNNFLDD